MSERPKLIYKVVKEFEATPTNGQPRKFTIGEEVSSDELYPFHEVAVESGAVIVISPPPLIDLPTTM